MEPHEMDIMAITNLRDLLAGVLERSGLSGPWALTLADILVRLIGVIVVLFLAWLANWIAKRLILRFVHHVAERSKTVWDDALVKHRVFTRLSHLAPGVVLYSAAPLVFAGHAAAASGMRTAAILYMVAVGWFVMEAFLSAVEAIYRTYPFAKRIPIRSLVQVTKIVLGLALFIVVLSILLQKNPSKLLTGMGAMTAVLLLVFKDAILGFVAGIQLSANRMIHMGDWIEMPKFGADGDVIDISLTTVKVQNWDKTISTIPTYALVSDSFKNWRGMSESGGRRIKRNINIDMTSIRFCDEAMLEKFKRFEHLTRYIETRQAEITAWNNEHKIDHSEPVNGRRLTNIGVFRAYLVAYLRNHPQIHKYMTFLVRHLEPTPQGLPIQIYVFSSDQVWSNYEAIQADIFDHILAVIPEFGLRVYQQPSGADFQSLMTR
jgi:miniconductance mechanosensitive channel